MFEIKNQNKYVRNIFIGITIILVLFLSLKKTIKENYEKKLISNNPVLIIGNIIRYTEVGLANYYLTYEYEVYGKKYNKTVLSNYVFKNCQHDNNCIGKKIYIRYYLNDFSISEPIFNKFPPDN